MSTHALVMPRGSKREQASSGSKTGSAGKARNAAAPANHALGGEPRVSLLPSEVNDFHKAQGFRRRLIGGVLAALLVVVAGIAGATFLQMDAQAKRDAAQAEALALVAEEASFADLKTAKSGIASIEAGQYVGASTEIDWKGYLEQLQATLPGGVTIDNVTIDSASPFVDYVQSTVPLEGARVATLVFTATSPTLPTIPDWLDGLGTLVGFADAVPGSVSVQTDGTYLVNITMHINSDAFSHRFSGEDQE